LGSAEPPDARVSGSTGVRAAVLLTAAVLLGLLLLRQFDAGTFEQSVDTGGTTDTTSREPTVSVIPNTTARPLRPPADVKVVAANGTSVSGLAAKTTEFMRQNGYNVLAPTDATRPIENSQVEYRQDFEPEARAVAQSLQLPASAVRPIESEPPVADTRSTDILVLIGDDLQLPGETTTTTRRP
jgi:hypothetical protein